MIREIEANDYRTIHVMMLMDCMSTFFFNTLPQISLSEMHLRLPCKDELFEQTSIRYSIPNSTDGQDDVQMIPALQDIVARLIQKETPLLSDQLLKVLEPRHLMMAIFGMRSSRL